MSDRAGDVPAGELPEGWAWVRLGDICQRVSKVDPAKYYSADFHYIDISAADREGLDLGKIKTYHKDSAPSRARQLVQSKDILFSTVRVYLRKKGVVSESLSGTIASTGFTVLRIYQGIVPEYIYYWLEDDRFVSRMTKAQRGTSYPAVRDDDVFDAMVPLAPFPEQCRIVEKIETLLSEIANGIDSLNAVDRKLATYRQSVLKAAVTGQLTRDWRGYPSRDSTGEAAVSVAFRGLEEHGIRAGKVATSAEVRDSEKPIRGLPSGWTWTRLYQVAEVVGGITKDKKRDSQPHRRVPYLRVANVQKGYLELSEVKDISAPEDAIEKLKLEPGDVLFTEGGDRDKLGRGWIWEGQLPECIHQNHILRARFYSKAISPRFVSWYANVFGQTYFMGQGAQTTNLASISLSKLKSFPIPVPPYEEVCEIVKQVDHRLTTIDHMREDFPSHGRSAHSLRRSILNAAFSGRLVPQDPDDEPASELLARIRAERANVPKTSGRRGQPRKTTRTSAGVTP